MSLVKSGLIFGCLAAGMAVAYMAFAMYIDNVEHPRYTTVLNDGDFEVRAYEPMTIAEIAVKGDRREAANKAFSPLASYIFANDREGEKIAMTAPVTQAAKPAEDTWTVSFVMPSQYSLASLPKPTNGEIVLREAGKSKRAVVRFGGVADDRLIDEKETKLREWLKTRGLKVVGGPTYAYYNSPFTPGFLRRNEIMFELAPGQTTSSEAAS